MNRSLNAAPISSLLIGLCLWLSLKILGELKIYFFGPRNPYEFSIKLSQPVVDSKLTKQLEQELEALCRNPAVLTKIIVPRPRVTVQLAREIIASSKHVFENIPGFELMLQGALGEVIAAIKDQEAELHKLCVLTTSLKLVADGDSVLEFGAQFNRCTYR